MKTFFVKQHYAISPMSVLNNTEGHSEYHAVRKNTMPFSEVVSHVMKT